jgi:hypothetical protein
MSRIIKSRRAQAVLAVVAALAIGVVAYAFWTSSGSGSTTASTQAGNGTTFTFSAINTPSGLAPGAGAKALNGTITNSDADTSYKLQTVTATISSVDKAQGAPAGTCDPSDYELSNASGTAWVISNGGDTATLSPQTELAHSGTYSWQNLQIAFVDKTTNQDACKGATVHVDYSAA